MACDRQLQIFFPSGTSPERENAKHFVLILDADRRRRIAEGDDRATTGCEGSGVSAIRIFLFCVSLVYVIEIIPFETSVDGG